MSGRVSGAVCCVEECALDIGSLSESEVNSAMNQGSVCSIL